MVSHPFFLPVTSATMKSFLLVFALMLSGFTSNFGRKLAQVRGVELCQGAAAGP